MTDSTTRRTFLGGLVTATLAGVAGCASGKNQSLTPSVPTDRLRTGGWTHADDFEERFERSFEVQGVKTTVTAHTKGTVYENAGPQEAVAEQFGVSAADVEMPGKVYTAAKARTDPSMGVLSSVTSPTERIVDEAEPQLRKQLRRMGFTNVRQVAKEDLSIDTGETATHYRYAMDYEYDPFEVDYRGVPVRVEPGTVPVETQFGTWIHDGLIVGAGGVYPGGDLSITATSKRRGVSRDVAVAFDAEAFRQEVESLITPVA